jgi:hypothetical protein
MLERVGIDMMIRWLGLLSVIIMCGCEELGYKTRQACYPPDFNDPKYWELWPDDRVHLATLSDHHNRSFICFLLLFQK